MTVYFTSSTEPGCTLANLRDRIQSRLSDLSDVRADEFINQAHTEFHEYYDWPWLHIEASGQAPFVLTDFGRVEYVLDTTTGTRLGWVDKDYLVGQVTTDLTQPGNPTYWYRDGMTGLAVYPANTTDDITVSYWREPAELVADTDETLNPSRYCPIVLDLAYAHALGEQQDNAELALSLLGRVEARIHRAGAKVMVPSTEPDMIVQTEWC